MKSNKISPYKIGFTYIGTVIGAGFSSGQEMFQFFTVFGSKGLLGNILITILYIFLGYLVMDLGYRIHCTSYIDIIRFSTGKNLSKLIDIIITLFLFTTIIIMFAGGGALFHQQFDISNIWGSLILAILTAITILAGLNGLMKSMTALVPLLLVFIIGISIRSIVASPFSFYNYDLNIGVPPSKLLPNWFISAILAFSYNMILIISVLGPLGGKSNDRKSMFKGTLLGGLLLGLCSLSINLALFGTFGEVFNIEMPMLYVAGTTSSTIQFIYCIIVFFSIYTTAIGASFGFFSRVIKQWNVRSKLLIIITTFFAFLLSRIGFSNLIKYLYPIEGYVGLFLLLSIILGRIRLKK